MTSATLNEMNSGMFFECSGHACGGEKGKDIVCAGVSALVIALLERLSVLSDEGIIKIESFHTGDGEVSVEISWRDAYGRQTALGVFETVAAGLSRISEMYPENVSCNF